MDPEAWTKPRTLASPGLLIQPSPRPLPNAEVEILLGISSRDPSEKDYVPLRWSLVRPDLWVAEMELLGLAPGVTDALQYSFNAQILLWGCHDSLGIT